MSTNRTRYIRIATPFFGAGLVLVVMMVALAGAYTRAASPHSPTNSDPLIVTITIDSSLDISDTHPGANVSRTVYFSNVVPGTIIITFGISGTPPLTLTAGTAFSKPERIYTATSSSLITVVYPVSTAHGSQDNVAYTVTNGVSTTVTITYVQDITAPIVSITSPIPSYFTGTQLIITGTAEDGSGAGVQWVRVMTGTDWITPSTMSVWTAALVFPANTDGWIYTITAQAEDYLGILGEVTRAITVDNKAPAGVVFTPNLPVDEWILTPTLDIQWVFTDGDDIAGYQYLVSSTAIVTLPSDGGAFTTSTRVTETLGNGQWYFHVAARDVAGNWSATYYTGLFQVDTASPTISISIPAPGAVLTKADLPTTSVSGTVSDAVGNVSGVSAVSVTLDGGGTYTDATLFGSNWEYEWNLPREDNVAHTLYARARDEADNTKLSSARVITVDTVAPTATSPAPDREPWITSTVVYTWPDSNDGAGIAGYQVNITNTEGYSILSPTVDSMLTFTRDLTDGVGYYARVRAIDDNGNVGDWSGSSTVVTPDLTAPSVMTPSIDTQGSGYLYAVGTTLYYTNQMGFDQSFYIMGYSLDELSGVDRVTFSPAFGESPEDDTDGFWAWSPAWPGYGVDPYTTTVGVITATVYDKVGNTKVQIYPYELDGKPPYTGSVVINDGAEFAASRQVTLTLFSDDTGCGVAEICINDTGAPCITWNPYVVTQPWTLETGDGDKTVYVWFQDHLQNISIVYTDSIKLDTIPPDDPESFSLADRSSGDMKYTDELTVTATITEAADVVAWLIAENQSDQPREDDLRWRSEKPVTFTLSVTDGLKTVYIWVKDQAGNPNTGMVSDTIVLDRQSPISGGVEIDGGASYVNQVTVTLALTATDDASGLAQMCISDGLSCNNWVAFTTLISWTLGGSDDGEKIVYARFRDRVGNESTSYSDTIVLDQQQPISGGVEIDGGAFYANQVTVTLALTATDDASGLYQMCISNKLSCNNWITFNTWVSWTLNGSDDGEKMVSAWFRDRAGNESTSYTDTIVLDRQPPGILGFSLADRSSGSTNCTNDWVVSATITATEAVTAWLIAEDQSEPPGENDSRWKPEEPVTFTFLPPGNRDKTVYIWVKDHAGNVNTSTVSVTITLDTDAPDAPGLSLTDRDSGNEDYTNELTVTVEVLGGAEGVMAWLIAEDQSSQPEESDSRWVPEPPVTFTLSVTEGLKTVYIWAKDCAGNVNNPSSFSIDTITLDATPPNDPDLSLADRSSGDTGCTNEQEVTVTVTETADVTAWLIAEDQSTRPDENDPRWGSKPDTFNLSGGDGLKTVYVWVKDRAGNINPGPISDTIELDTVPSDVLEFSLADRSSGDTDCTNGRVVTVTVTETEDVTAWLIAEDQSDQPDEDDLRWRPKKPVTFTLSPGNGDKTVYIWVKDCASNHGSSSATITLDTVPPDDPGLLLTDRSTGDTDYTNELTVTVTATGTEDVTAWLIAEDQSDQPDEDDPRWRSERPVIFTLSATDELKTVYVWVKDCAGNINPNPVSDTITLDTDPPGDPSLSLADRSSGNTDYTNELTVTATVTGEAIDVTAWLIAEDQSIQPAEDDPRWETKPVTFTLSDGDESKTVCIWVKDHAANINPGPISDIITLDTISPTSVVTSPEYATSSPISVTWVATDTNSGVYSVTLWYKKEIAGTWIPTMTKIISSESGASSVKSEFDLDRLQMWGDTRTISNIWRWATPKRALRVCQADSVISGTFEFYPPDGDGLYLFAISAADNAENWEARPAFSETQTMYDTVISPVIDLVVDPDNWTTANAFTLTWDNPADLSGIAAAYYKLDTDPVSNTNGKREPGDDRDQISNVSVDGPGEHLVWVWLEDKAGKVDYTAAQTTTLKYSIGISPPLNLTVTPFVWTNVNSFTLTWENPTGTADIVGAYYELDTAPEYYNDGTWVEGHNLTHTTGITVMGDGAHTAWLWLKNIAGSIDHLNAAATTTLRYDGTPPTNVVITAPESVSGKAFVVEWDADTSISGPDRYDVRYRIENGAWHGWLTGTTETSGMFTALVGDITYTFGVTTYDCAGNSAYTETETYVGPFRIYLPIVVRNYPPQPIGSVKIEDGATYIHQQSVTLYLTATVAGDTVDQMCISNSPVCTDWIAFTKRINWTLKGGASGLRTVYVWFKGSTGGISKDAASDTIYLEWNRSFETGDFTGWQHGGELRQFVRSDHPHTGAYSALLGDPDYPDKGVPIGNARIWQTFSVPSSGNPEITIWYRIYTYDIVWGNKSHKYFDSFEIYINDTDWGDANNPDPDDLWRKKRCRDERHIPDTGNAGLVFCDGFPDPHENLEDLLWRDATLNLSQFKGQTITLYLANFNRVDHGWNTWTYVDDICVNW